jgi:two-component system, NtrC family, sensor histidine kinase HydH
MKDFIESMMKECSRIDDLIDDLLRYVKPIRLDLRQVDIAATIREVVALYDAAAVANGCRLEVLASGACPPVTADPDKIKQVLMNIIKNAIEAKAKTVTLSVTEREGQIVARIADDGGGIAGKHLGSIFRPFFTTKKAGTGLGLPICMKIVEEHGGTLSLESREGAGTTVELALK